jgi:hypothetical protein
MNGFERHDIDHGSASMVNDAINNPGKFIAHRCFKNDWPIGSAGDRGNAIEAGIEQVVVYGKTIEEAIAYAYKIYDADVALKLTDRFVQSNREKIELGIMMGVEAFKPYGKALEPELDPSRPERKPQHKVKINCKTPFWELPLIGYLDFVFPNPPSGVPTIIDLKTIAKIPRVMSKQHQRQRAIYAAAKPGFDVKFIYVSPASTVTLEDGDVPQIMSDMKKALIRWERFLNLGDADFLASIVPMAPDDSEFNTTARKELLREKFGF